EDEEFAAGLIERAPDKVAVGIDAKDGMVAIRGWVTVSTTTAALFAKRVETLGASCIIYTDISRDGTLSGPNIKATMELASTIDIPVIASGGMSRLEDIEAYKKAEAEYGKGLGGIIIGRALYAGTIGLKDAIKRAG
ncbi:MAG: 1-(5-phosphoribosyl)-5-((5-phosphoribosylamino)methylideneamino)imidazole-4-carboxamide isomerase, partial [Deltaproteobacteria bacterium]|nr:1-(5-phosphoribosyl)-5-((5-phosphoribosylamino)methylideneamino)imidazole-4-carboxamide isomerase [Deltaproteobacteria bacterium]